MSTIDDTVLDTAQELQTIEDETHTQTTSLGKGGPTIEFFLHYQRKNSETGELEEVREVYDPNIAQIFYVEKYSKEHENPNLFLLDLAMEGISAFDLALISLKVLEKANVANTSCNPYLPNAKFTPDQLEIPEEYSNRPNIFTHAVNHAADCTPYYLGVAMMKEFERLQKEVSYKIHKQGLSGYIPVDLMCDFHLGCEVFDEKTQKTIQTNNELRSVARYPGHSVDIIYSLVTPKQRIPPKFKEYQEDQTANAMQYKFFNDPVINLEKL